MEISRAPIVAIVCAKNEAQRIGPVLDVLMRKLPVLVVNDGSTDATALVAQQKGAAVLNLPRNVGKGRAMLAGVNALPNARIVVFIDADLKGLRPEHIDRLVQPVVNGQFGMVVGMRDYGNALNQVVQQLPLISGERAVRRDLLAAMPPQAWQGYAVETWMNHVVAKQGARIGTTLLPGVSVVLKWDKEPNDGFHKMVDMGAEVVGAHVQVEEAMHPPSGLGAPGIPKGNASQSVMRDLSRTLVEVGGPYVQQHLWTPAAQRQVGDAIGRRLALPLWSIACVACAGFFGPTAGLVAAIGALAVNHPGWRRDLSD